MGLGRPGGRNFGDDDERMHEWCASGLAHGKGLGMPARYRGASTERFRAFRPPALGVLWAAVWRDGNRLPIRCLLSVLGALAAAASAWAGGMLFGRVAGIAAGLVAAGYPALVWLSVHLLGETPCVLAVTLSFACALRAARDRSWAWAAAVFHAAAVLSRSVLIGFLPLHIAWAWRCAGGRRAAATLLGFAAAMAPWWARNAAVLGAFVPTTTDGGECFYIGNHPRALGDPRGYWMPPDWSMVDGLDECGANRRLYALGLAHVRAHPREALLHAFEKLGRFWRPWPHARYVGRLAAAVDGAAFLPFAILAAWGLRLAWKGGGLPRAAAGWVLLLTAYLTVAHMAVLATTRYRSPLYGVAAPFTAMGALFLLRRARLPQGKAGASPA